MSDTLGYKTTFWKLINKQSVSIPTLQRDYIYGAGTNKTEEVLTNMLLTFKTALEVNDKEETLDFVYGSDSLAKEFMPLDGQQRLTTLFLLHYYAALTDQNLEGEENKEYRDSAFDVLSRFSYATRNCTIAFCQQILIKKHEEIAQEIQNHIDYDKVVSNYLENLDEFRGSFYADPSIMSMLVVLDKIHCVFRHYDNLWHKLTSDNCPINFYILDFGKFDLSDDLYNKMNSRGKPLTSFEIIKAKIHKYIRKINVDKANQMAIKFDTDWMQFIWETLNYTPNLKEVDPSYMNFLRNMFVCFDYISGYERQQYYIIDDDCLKHNLTSPTRIKVLKSVLDIFSSRHINIPDSLKTDFMGCLSASVCGELHAVDFVRLYSYFIGLYQNLDEEEFCIRQRHIRNLIANSSDHIREEHLTDLLKDTSRVMHGKILNYLKARGFNTLSWQEEQEKERHREVWQSLYQYEDVKEINGTLQAFCSGLNDDNKLDLGNEDFVILLKERLEKAKYFFIASSEAKMEEYQMRSALLSLADYSMFRLNHGYYRYFGVINGSWQNFTGYHKFGDRGRIMNVIDQIDVLRPITEYVGDTSKTTAESWRYYAIKYAHEITVAYRSPDYGYIYFPAAYSTGTYFPEDKNIDVSILQSGYFSDTNVAWKMLNRLLEVLSNENYNLYLDSHGGSPIILSRISNEARLDIQSDGWHLYGIDSSILSEVGIDHTEIVSRQEAVIEDNGSIVQEGRNPECLCLHIIGNDYVVEGQEILNKLSSKYHDLAKLNK